MTYRRKNLFDGPPAFESVLQALVCNSQVSSPVAKAEALTLEGEESGAGLYLSGVLFIFRGPAHIADFVVAIGGDAIQRIQRTTAWAPTRSIRKAMSRWMKDSLVSRSASSVVS